MLPDKLLWLVDRFLLRMSVAASDYLEWDIKKGLYHVTKLTCVALRLTITEISDAVAFMCTLRFFKRVEPAIAIVGVYLQPFSVTVAHVTRKE